MGHARAFSPARILLRRVPRPYTRFYSTESEETWERALAELEADLNDGPDADHKMGANGQFDLGVATPLEHLDGFDFKPKEAAVSSNLRNASSNTPGDAAGDAVAGHSAAVNAADHSSDFLVLNPIQARIVKVRPKRFQGRRGSKPVTSPPTTYLDTLGLLDEPDTEPVLAGIHAQRPETTQITRQRWDQICHDLVKGFKKAQLEEYLVKQRVSSSLVRRMTKRKLAEHILGPTWKTSVKETGTQEQDAAMVENVIQLSEAEFVLMLGGKGRLLREWSKSGALIALRPSRFQIIVQSSPLTYKWITASLGSFLGSIQQRELVLPLPETAASSANVHAPTATSSLLQRLYAVMQSLTDTFFRPKQDRLVVHSGGKARARNIGLVERLLLQAAQHGDTRGRPASWLFDTSKHGRFQAFSDTDALEWIDRTQAWWRWEAVKRRTAEGGATGSANAIGNADHDMVKLEALQAPQFGETPAGSEGSLAEELAAVATQLRSDDIVALNGEPVSATLTVTPGFVLHNQASLAGVPHAGTEKTFTSNIPFVANVASSLSWYAQDVRDEPTDITEEASAATTGSDASTTGSDASDPWARLLDLDTQKDDAGRQVFVTPEKHFQFDHNLKLVQLKFVPHPHEADGASLPPIEAWAELPSLSAANNELLEAAPRVVAVPREASAFVALPSRRADLKLTCAQTYPVPLSAAMEEYFMRRTRFGRLGLLDIPPELEVTLGERTARYCFHSSVYVTLAELAFRGSLLQFSQVEGGRLGGRKVEANLVQHAEAGTFTADEVRGLAERAAELTTKISK